MLRVAIGAALVLVLAHAPVACLDDSALGANDADAVSDVSDVSGVSDAGDGETTPPADGRDDVGGDAGDTTADDAAPRDDVAPADTTLVDTRPPEDSRPPADTTPADTTPVDDAQPETTEPADTGDTAADGDDLDPACTQCSALRPIIMVHGINGSPDNYDVMLERFRADGWPDDYLVRFAAADPAWGCNVDNAAAIAALVDDVRARTCQPRVDIVAHSMGTLSSRYYVKNLGGTTKVNTYVTLGGMHHGLFTPCLAPEFLGICVWQELCQSGAYIAALNADPATPGELHWVSIYGTADATVPNESSHLDGAENIVIEGAEHDGPNGLLQRQDAYDAVKRVLGYDCW